MPKKSTEPLRGEAARKWVLQRLREGWSVNSAVVDAGLTPPAEAYWRRQIPGYAEQRKQAMEEGRRRKAVGDGFRATKDPLPVPDFPEFCERYLGQRLFAHQLQWFDMLEGRPPRDLHPSCVYEEGNPRRLLINTPTGHAKSTTITVNYVVWRIVRDPNVKIKIVSKSQRMAEDFLLQVKERLTAPVYADLQRDFGPEGGYASNAASWKANRFYVSSDIRDAEQKDPTCEALGIRGQIYGARADVLILDDCVDSINVGDFEKQIRWIQGMLMNRLGRNGVLLVVGTRIAAQDMYSELMTPAYYGGRRPPWTYLAQKAVLEFADDPADWVTLWPRTDSAEDSSMQQGDDGLFDKWDGPLLSERRDEVGPVEFSRMYQQETVAEDNPFRVEHMVACQQGRLPGLLPDDGHVGRVGGMRGLRVVAGLDPAAVGHTAAVVVALDADTGVRYVLDVFDRAGCQPTDIRELLMSWTERYGVDEWRIERNAFQAYLTRDPEVVAGLANRGAVLTEHTTGTNKHDPNFGVLAMAALFEQGLVSLPRVSDDRVRRFVDQLAIWSPNPARGVKTDMVMAWWFAEIRCRDLVVNRDVKAMWRDSQFLSRSDTASRRVLSMQQYEADFAAQAAQFTPRRADRWT